MAYILSIETADKGCSVAIHNAGQLLAKKEDYEGKSSSSGLTLLIQACVIDAHITYAELAAIAVSKGPGSYTGLRIGVSTAKGMCYGLDIPLIGIDSLDTIAAAYSDIATGLICPMLDARRLEVYCKILDIKTGRTCHQTAALVLDETSFQKELISQKIYFCGPGSEKAKPFLKSPHAIFSISQAGPDAEFMGKVAYELFKEGKVEDLVEFEPFYLKDFLALKSKKKMPLDKV